MSESREAAPVGATTPTRFAVFDRKKGGVLMTASGLLCIFTEQGVADGTAATFREHGRDVVVIPIKIIRVE